MLIYLLGILLYESTRKNYRRREENGSAKWGDAGKINKKYKQPNNYNKILTKNVSIGLNGKKHRRNVNVLVIGGSGAGKTFSYCKPNVMQCSSSYVILDPKGEILRQKCIKKNGNIRYANKNACRHCKNRNKCYKGKGEWKEIDFTKDTLEKPCKEWLKAEGKECENAKQAVKGHFEKVKVVKFFLKPSFEKMSQRMCLSEHPFGTIKRAMGATYFLLKGLRKVTGEFALFCLGYNMERAKNLLGFEKMMQLMATA